MQPGGPQHQGPQPHGPQPGKRNWYSRIAIWADPLLCVLLIGAGAALVVWGLNSGDMASALFFAVPAFLAGLVFGESAVSGFRRRAGIPAPPPEPESRPLYDAYGRMQETERGARSNLWMAPLFSVVLLIGGGIWAVNSLRAEDPITAIVVGGGALFLASGGWLEFVHSRRAVRSDEREYEWRLQQQRFQQEQFQQQQFPQQHPPAGPAEPGQQPGPPPPWQPPGRS